jgi:hypothetical protein
MPKSRLRNKTQEHVRGARMHQKELTMFMKASEPPCNKGMGEAVGHYTCRRAHKKHASKQAVRSRIEISSSENKKCFILLPIAARFCTRPRLIWSTPSERSCRCCRRCADDKRWTRVVVVQDGGHNTHVPLAGDGYDPLGSVRDLGRSALLHTRNNLQLQCKKACTRSSTYLPITLRRCNSGCHTY